MKLYFQQEGKEIKTKENLELAKMEKSESDYIIVTGKGFEATIQIVANYQIIVNQNFHYFFTDLLNKQKKERRNKNISITKSVSFEFVRNEFGLTDKETDIFLCDEVIDQNEEIRYSFLNVDNFEKMLEEKEKEYQEEVWKIKNSGLIAFLKENKINQIIDDNY